MAIISNINKYIYIYIYILCHALWHRHQDCPNVCVNPYYSSLLRYLTGEADGMEQLKQLMAFRANLDKVTDKKVRNLDPGEKDSQAGVTVNSVVPQNGYTSTVDDGLEKPAKDESRCLLVVTGSGTAWLRVRTKYDCLLCHLADICVYADFYKGIT